MIHRLRWAGVSAALLMLLSVACNRSGSQAPESGAAQPSAAEPHEHGENHAGGDMEGFAIALAPTQGNQATGTLMVMSMGDGVHFSGVVSGLTPGPHALHIHEKGDCSAPDASSAGGHFNPAAADHGAPDSAARHAGDLGNIIAGADGRAEINIHASGLSLGAGASSVQGRAIVVHAGEDDFKTQPAGNAGSRVACGVIQATQ